MLFPQYIASLTTQCKQHHPSHSPIFFPLFFPTIIDEEWIGAILFLFMLFTNNTTASSSSSSPSFYPNLTLSDHSTAHPPSNPPITTILLVITPMRSINSLWTRKGFERMNRFHTLYRHRLCNHPAAALSSRISTGSVTSLIMIIAAHRGRYSSFWIHLGSFFCWPLSTHLSTPNILTSPPPLSYNLVSYPLTSPFVNLYLAIFARLVGTLIHQTVLDFDCFSHTPSTFFLFYSFFDPLLLDCI